MSIQPHPHHPAHFVDHGHEHVFYDERGHAVGALPSSSGLDPARAPYHGGRAKKPRK